MNSSSKKSRYTLPAEIMRIAVLGPLAGMDIEEYVIFDQKINVVFDSIDELLTAVFARYLFLFDYRSISRHCLPRSRTNACKKHNVPRSVKL